MPKYEREPDVINPYVENYFTVRTGLDADLYLRPDPQAGKNGGLMMKQTEWTKENDRTKMHGPNSDGKPDEIKEYEGGGNGKLSRGDWINLFGYAVTLLGFYPVNEVGKAWLGQGVILGITQFIIAVIVLLVLGEIVGIVLRRLGDPWRIRTRLFGKLPLRAGQVMKKMRKYNPIKRYSRLKFILPVCSFMFAVVFFGVEYYCPKTACYASVSEVYGLPRGIGEPLTKEECKDRAFYWEIKEYSLSRRVVLEYKDAYGQTELFRKYSTAYRMDFFRPCARVEYRFRKNKGKFLDAGQEEAARTVKENGYRELVEASYYGSDGKLLMRLKKDGSDTYEICSYSAEDMPQLFQSTLLRARDMDSQDDEDNRMGGNDLSAQQIEVSYDSKGLPVMRRLNAGISNLCGVNGERYEYDQEMRLRAIWYLDANGQAICNKQGIMQAQFEYDRNGNLKNIRYFSDEDGNQKTEGFYGVFQEAFEYNPDGNLILRKQLDRNGNGCYDRYNVCTYRYTYQEGKLVKEEYLGPYGELYRDNEFHSGTVEFHSAQENGEHKILVSFDFVSTSVQEADDPAADAKQPEQESTGPEDSGDEILEAWLNLSDRQEGQGEREKETKSSADKQLTLQKRQRTSPEFAEDMQTDLAGGDKVFERNYASVGFLVDRKNRILEEAYYDGEGSLVFNEQGYALKKIQYDDNAKVVGESFCGVDGQGCLTEEGYASVKNTYASGAGGMLEKQEYLGLDGKRALNKKLGYASVRYDRGSEDGKRIVVRTYKDASDHPIRIPGKDYAVIEKIYDENGRLERTAYYDEEGVAVNRSDYGIAEVLYEYDENGNQVCEWYKDAYGDPVNRSDTGFAVLRQEYEAGQLVMTRYQGYRNQKLVDVADKNTGASMVRYAYEHGRKKEEQYFDAEAEPVLRKDTGYSKVEYDYDERGKNCAQRYYGADGELTLRKDLGCAVVEYEYNDFGQHTFSRYYGVDGAPAISSKYQCAGFEYVYDDSGNNTDIYYLGPQENYIVRVDLGIAHIRREYDASGNLEKESYYDAQGNPSTYRDDGYASYEDTFENGRVVESRYFDKDGNPVLCEDGGYAMVRYEYDDAGKKRSEKYYGESGELVINSKYHCAGFEYEYDARGNRRDTRYLDLEEKRMVRPDLGYAWVHSEYDELGNEIRASYYDEEGNPAVWKEGGCAVSEFKYDRGNCVERRYLDEKGNLTLRVDTGYAILRNEYDDFGRRTKVTYFDTKDQPIVHKTDYCAGIKYLYDDMGRQTDTCYLGTDGGLLVRKDLGYAQVHSEYDELGNECLVSYLDEEGKPAVWKEGGCAYSEYEYNNRGKRVKTTYLDKEGNPVAHRGNGYASIENEYDEHDQCIAENYYDREGNPVISTEYHCAGRRFGYDERGRRIDTSYVGLDGALMIRRDLGYATIHTEHDVYGNEIKASYYDVNGNPAVWKKGGNVSCEFLYQGGNCVERRYYDAEGSLMTRADEDFAVVRYEYDEYGKKIAESYLDEEEQPVISKKYNCARIEYQYDSRDNMTDKRFFGTDGTLMVRPDLGYAYVHWDYDAFDHEEEIFYYNAEEQETVRKDGGYASCKYRYDDRGRCIERAYFGLEGQPVARNGDGYSMVQYEYDELGQCILESYLGTGGKPVINTEHHAAGRKFTFDKRGNRTDTEYLDLEGNPMVVKDWGYARKHSDYDDFGNEVKISYLDLSGSPVVWKTGNYAFHEKKYQGKLCVEGRFYDTKGNPVNRKDKGYAVISSEYNEFGQLVREEYYDNKEEQVLHKEMYCAGRKFAYDEKGNRTDTWFIGLEGEPINREDIGYAHVHSVYDPCGRELEAAYFDVNEQSVMRKDGGYASCKFEYKDGKCVMERYYDVEGNPVLRNDGGYAITEYSYNELGQKNWVVYRDTNEKIGTNTNIRCSGISYEYDERGNETYLFYRDKDWHETDREDLGFALNFKVYDAYGNMTLNSYYSADKESDGSWKRAVNLDLGYAAEEKFYEGNFWLGRRYLGADGELVVPEKIGYAMLKQEFNDMDQVVRASYYDAEGNLTNYDIGNVETAVIEYVTGPTGEVVHWTYYDKDNNILPESNP